MGDDSEDDYLKEGADGAPNPKHAMSDNGKNWLGSSSTTEDVQRGLQQQPSEAGMTLSGTADGHERRLTGTTCETPQTEDADMADMAGSESAAREGDASGHDLGERFSGVAVAEGDDGVGVRFEAVGPDNEDAEILAQPHERIAEGDELQPEGEGGQSQGMMERDEDLDSDAGEDSGSQGLEADTEIGAVAEPEEAEAAEGNVSEPGPSGQMEAEDLPSSFPELDDISDDSEDDDEEENVEEFTDDENSEEAQDTTAEQLARGIDLQGGWFNLG